MELVIKNGCDSNGEEAFEDGLGSPKDHFSWQEPGLIDTAAEEETTPGTDLYKQGMELNFRYCKNRGPSTTIEDLPEDMLHLILNKLSILHVVQTCALSKDWRNRWAQQSCLCLDHSFLKNVIERREESRRPSEFVRIVYAIILAHLLNLKTFNLLIPHYFNLQHGDIEGWLHSLSIRSRSLENIVIDNDNDEVQFRVPNSLYRFSKLKSLCLYQCVVRTPPVHYGGFTNLTKLYFERVRFSGNFFGGQH